MINLARSVSLSADGSRVAIGAIAMMAMEVIRVTRGCMSSFQVELVLSVYLMLGYQA